MMPNIYAMVGMLVQLLLLSAKIAEYTVHIGSPGTVFRNMSETAFFFRTASRGPLP